MRDKFENFIKTQTESRTGATLNKEKVWKRVESKLHRKRLDSCSGLPINSKIDIISIGTVHSPSGTTKFSHTEIVELPTTPNLKRECIICCKPE
jgi:hypothetical protein